MIQTGRRIRWQGVGALAMLMLTCAGCSPATTRNVASFVFDGVPAPPAPDQYCAPWLTERQVVAGPAGQAGPGGSFHPPYKEKRCNDCHDLSKTKGLVAPLKELCFRCHDTIIQGAYAHAPAASGECLNCHLPHDAPYVSLLKEDTAKLCNSCHAEPRMALSLHDRSAKAGITCPECHDPHAGSTKFFLK